MQFSDDEISKYTGVPLSTLTKIRQEAVKNKKIALVQKRPVRMDLAGAVTICQILEVDMTREQLEGWISAKKNALEVRKAKVLPTNWHNKKMLRAQLPEGDEIRIRVRDVNQWRVGAMMQVIPEHDLLYAIDPEWSNRDRTRAMSRRGRR